MSGQSRPVYTLRADDDGFLYICSGGAQDSRKGIRPVNELQRQVLDTLVEGLNDLPPTRPELEGAALELMLKIW